MEEENSLYLKQMRSANRSELNALRSKQRDALHSCRRLRLSEVTHEDCFSNISLKEFSELIFELKKKSVSFKVIKKIRNNCITEDHVGAIFKNKGVFEAIVSLFIGCDAHKQLEASGCLINMTCFNHKITFKIARTVGAYIVLFFKSGSCFLREQCIWAAGNIVHDCLECFNILKAQGILHALMDVFHESLPNVTESTIFLLSACLKYEEPEIINMIQPELPKILLSLLLQEEYRSSENVFLDTAFALFYCSHWHSKYDLGIFDVSEIEIIIKILHDFINSKEKAVLVNQSRKSPKSQREVTK